MIRPAEMNDLPAVTALALRLWPGHTETELAGEMGCTEFASDCELDNTDSLRFHLHAGFEEAGRIICLRKSL